MCECPLTRCAAQQSSIHRRPRRDAATERVGSPLQQVLKSLLQTLNAFCADCSVQSVLDPGLYFGPSSKSRRLVRCGRVAEISHCDTADIVPRSLVTRLLTHDAFVCCAAACRYGGGPAVNYLYVCHTCQVEYETLQKRRKSELDMFVRVRLVSARTHAHAHALTERSYISIVLASCYNIRNIVK